MSAPPPSSRPMPAGPSLATETTARGPWAGMDPERRRMTLALTFSLIFHALLLSLTFGGQGMGLPGFGFPWQERRAEVPVLHVVLGPAQPGGAPTPATPAPVAPPQAQAPSGQPVAGGAPARS
ncbi:MAG: hypothetical protein ACT6UC_00005, partial [Hydrogenophaga sp.]